MQHAMPGVWKMVITTFELLFILLLIMANGLLAMSEIAIVSARKARLQQRAADGDKGARAALELATAPNRFLATIQIGITLVGILAGAVGGATIAESLTVPLSRIPLVAPYSKAVSLGIVVLSVTYLSLVIGELAPKRLALQSPERIAAAVAPSMHLLSVIASPAVYLLSLSTEMVLRIVGMRPSLEPPVTEEEVRIMIEIGTQAGVFQAAEQDLVERIFRFGDRRVDELMTPRLQIVWLDVDDPREENWQKMVASGHSLFPVFRGNLDNVLGMASVGALWARMVMGQPTDLQASLVQPLFVPETMSALKVLELFKQSGLHVALVMDEYGSIQGLVTLTDVLEAIVGDIPAIGERIEPQAVQREDASWLLAGCCWSTSSKRSSTSRSCRARNGANIRRWAAS